MEMKIAVHKNTFEALRHDSKVDQSMVLVIITELALRPIQSTNCKDCIKEISSHTVIVKKFSASCMQIFVKIFLDFKFKIYILNLENFQQKSAYRKH